jgi:hypothetical protein
MVGRFAEERRRTGIAERERLGAVQYKFTKTTDNVSGSYISLDVLTRAFCSTTLRLGLLTSHHRKTELGHHGSRFRTREF